MHFDFFKCCRKKPNPETTPLLPLDIKVIPYNKGQKQSTFNRLEMIRENLASYDRKTAIKEQGWIILMTTIIGAGCISGAVPLLSRVFKIQTLLRETLFNFDHQAINNSTCRELYPTFNIPDYCASPDIPNALIQLLTSRLTSWVPDLIQFCSDLVMSYCDLEDLQLRVVIPGSILGIAGIIFLGIGINSCHSISSCSTELKSCRDIFVHQILTSEEQNFLREQGIHIHDTSAITDIINEINNIKLQLIMRDKPSLGMLFGNIVKEYIHPHQPANDDADYDAYTFCANGV